MPTFVTHVVIGERVFAGMRSAGLPTDEKNYGPFLLGCILADVNNFNGVDRRKTHFVGRLQEDGPDAFSKSCSHFLAQLDTLLVRYWSSLTTAEQHFVAGYLCHLAADEAWKLFTWRWMHKLGIASLDKVPVPGSVVLTAFDVIGTKTYLDFPAIVSALKDAVVPNVLAHVPHQDLVNMWDTVREHALNGRTPESYFKLLERMGKDEARIRMTRLEHEQYWQEAMSLIQDLGGIEPVMQAGVARSLDVLPQLWSREEK